MGCVRHPGQHRAPRPFDSSSQTLRSWSATTMTYRDQIFELKQVECPEPVEGQWFVYLIECSDHSLYCGSSNNLKRRIGDHNKGYAASYTRQRRPVQLVYYENHSSLLSARRREEQIKKWSKKKKMNLVNGIWSKRPSRQSNKG